jgi:hypothetical protein
MSGNGNIKTVEVDELLVAMNRLGDILDQQLIPALREGAEKVDETSEERAERLERALIRQKIVNAFLFSMTLNQLGRDPLRGPAKLTRMLSRLAAQTDEEWEEHLRELEADAEAADNADEAGDGRSDAAARKPLPPPSLEDVEARRARKQLGREVQERALRRTLMIRR